MHHTVFDKGFKILDSDKTYKYQEELTGKLDKLREEFDYNILNEIVLWKVNRYSQFSQKTIDLINSIAYNDKSIDQKKIRRVLRVLLKTPGVQIAMASTILRFRNPQLFQIMDQRVYRIINPGKTLKLSTSESNINIENTIDIYLKYLEQLKKVASELKIEYKEADRVLYMADRRINRKHKLSN